MPERADRPPGNLTRRDLLAGTAAAAALLASASLRSRPAAAQDEKPMVWGSTLDLTLDPHTQLNVGAFFLKVNIYDSLYEYVIKDGTPEPVPLLVSEAKSSDGGAVWDFTLRTDVKFHDGRLLEAEDVVYSFKRLMALGMGSAPIFTSFLAPDDITAVAPDHVRFKLKTPYGPFLATLPMVPIVNRRLVEANAKDGDWGKVFLSGNTAGSGPYQPVPGSFVPAQRLDLAWFPDYFRGWPQPKPMKEVLLRFIAENSVQYLAVEKGEIDTTNSYVPADQYKRFRDSPNVTLSIEPTLRTFLFRMHNQRPPFDNPDYRKALSYAFPYQIYIDKVLRGSVQRNGGPIPRQLWGNPADLAIYSHDPAKAKEHLERARKAGAPVDREIEFVGLVSNDETVQAAQLMQSELRKIGIRMKISKALWANVVAATQKPETSPDIWAHWATSYFVDPDNFTGTFYTKATHGSQRGSSWYANDKVDGLLLKARHLTERAERTPIYEEVSRLLVADAVDIWIYNGNAVRAVRKRVKGYQPAAIGDGVDLRTIWIEA